VTARLRRTAWAPLTLVATLVGALGTQGCGQRSSAAQGTAPSPSASAENVASHVHVAADLIDGGRVKVAPVEKRAPRAEVRFPAEVAPSDQGRAEASCLTAGRVASIEVVAFAKVDKGDVLAWVDAPEVGRAIADLLRARARAEVARRKLARQLELEKERATSASAVDDARADALVADADLSAARTWVASLGAGEPPSNLTPGAPIAAKVAVRAPIAGVVLKRFAVVGGAVSADHPLFELAAPDALVVLARVPETTRLPVPGTHVSIAPRAQGVKPCGGTVAADAAVYDPLTRTRAVRVTPDATCAGLAAGGFADVVAIESAEGAVGLIVPRAAVVDVRGAPVVFVERKDTPKGEFLARAVRVGGGAGALEGEDVLVESGLSAGDRVVVVGALLLKGELLRAELGGE
jgi:cobalt-zinc-cadmium efflux system membrane fusion protein